MLSCSPKCKEDSECQGRKCCPNICNMRSCVPANHKSSGNDGYKNSNQSKTFRFSQVLFYMIMPNWFTRYVKCDQTIDFLGRRLVKLGFLPSIYT
nr:unnamed protein product [Callosobruchus chinensis]